jgi:arylsulfatase A-like enzyme
MADKPNILFILIDDMGWRDLGCYGSTFHETPVIDRLAREGALFTNAYAACPVCSPSRASILSGKYPARVGVTNFIGGHTSGRLTDAPYTRELPLTETSLASALRDGGYQTWHVGKWHLGEEACWPTRHGFDVNIGGCDWGLPRYGYVSPYRHPTLPDGPAGEYLTDRLTGEALRLIAGAGDQPFFLNLWHYAVHVPITVTDAALVEKYREKARRLGLDSIDCFEEGDYFPCVHKQDQRIVRRLVQSDPNYAAMIENLDSNIGRLLDGLAAVGKLDTTIIIFSSDNGGLSTAEGSPTCNAPLSEGKGWMYDGGVREPLIVRWPGVVTPGSVHETLVSSPDFYPTLLEAAGLPARPQQHADGVSFMPVLRGEGGFERGPLYWHYPHYGNQGGTPGCAVRDGDYKLLRFFEDEHRELFNLAQDPGETTDLLASEPAVAARLDAALTAWLAAMNARLPTTNPDFQPWRDGGSGARFKALPLDEARYGNAVYHGVEASRFS